MPETPAFEELLALIEDRSAALRAGVAACPGLDVRIPSCPDWSLRDLVEHLNEVHRFWAAAVAAGPSDSPPPTCEPAHPDDASPADLLTQSAAATRELTSALRDVGPAAGCWTWWGDSDVPMTSGAVARHQVHEAAVHAFDAQLAAGTAQPVPVAVALDGIAESIGVSYGTADPWPYGPARIGLHTDEGPSWLLDPEASGSIVLDDRVETVADLHGSASDLLLTLHGRLSPERLRSRGDLATLRRLLSWPDLS
jgi:uncharacterized protein (TIGR03083 family)